MAKTLPAHPVLIQAERLGRRLTETEEVRRFREAERQIQRSGRVQGLIEEIKRKQKELVHAKHYQKTNYIRRLEEELDRLQQELEDLPIVREYQQSQVEMNDLLQMIQRWLSIRSPGKSTSKREEISSAAAAEEGRAAADHNFLFKPRRDFCGV